MYTRSAGISQPRPWIIYRRADDLRFPRRDEVLDDVIVSITNRGDLIVSVVGRDDSDFSLRNADGENVYSLSGRAIKIASSAVSLSRVD